MRNRSMRLRVPGGIAVGLAWAAVCAPLLEAQAVGASIVVLSAQHRLLGNPLVGAAISNRVTDRADWWFRVAVEGLRGQAKRVGIPCGGGPFAPGTCAPERLRDDARLLQVTGGVGRQLLAESRVTLAVTADLGIARLGVVTRALDTGASLSTGKTLGSGLLGAELSWLPSRQGPIGVAIQLRTGGFLPLVQDDAADAYAPFEPTFGASNLHVGLTWRLTSAPSSVTRS